MPASIYEFRFPKGASFHNPTLNITETVEEKIDNAVVFSGAKRDKKFDDGNMRAVVVRCNNPDVEMNFKMACGNHAWGYHTKL